MCVYIRLATQMTVLASLIYIDKHLYTLYE